MSLCVPDAAGMVTAWAIHPGGAFSNGWGQGGPLLTPAITSLGTHVHVWEGWLLLQERVSGLTCVSSSLGRLVLGQMWPGKLLGWLGSRSPPGLPVSAAGSSADDARQRVLGVWGNIVA